MRTLVTGGAGFIGRWVVAGLLAQGHEVTVLDDFSSGRMENLDSLHESRRLRVIRGDIARPEEVAPAFSPRPEVVFHLAACINVQHSIDRPAHVFRTDVTGTFNLLETARSEGCRFVQVSTCMVYAPMQGEEGLNEESPVRPASPYAGAKLAAEHLAESFAHAYGLPVVNLRPFNTYGPYQRVDGEGGVIAVFLNRRLNGEALQVYGSGTQTRDFLYVEDCADFIIRAGLGFTEGFHLLAGGSGREISINVLAALIADDKVPVRHVPHIHPQSEIPRLRCDPSRARRLLGWTPRVDLEEGIRKTLHWLEGGRTS